MIWKKSRAFWGLISKKSEVEEGSGEEVSGTLSKGPEAGIPTREKGQAKKESPGGKPDHPTGRGPVDKGRQEDKTKSGSGRRWGVSDFDVPAEKGKVRFHDLGLPDQIMHSIADLGFKYCTPIQAEILPSVLEGKDATGRAQTGTGKTAAFLISAFTRMLRQSNRRETGHGAPRVLIIAPTRELVMQIESEAVQLAKYCGFRIAPVFGGMDYEKQRDELRKHKVDVVVATPGRLLDYYRKRDIHLNRVEILVIDEADRMLDMGFIPDVRRIINATPPKTRRQTMLFSATLTSAITRLASQWTRDPVEIEIEPEQVAVDTVEQVVYNVTTRDKFALLYNVITRKKMKRVLVFCNRRDETRRLDSRLRQYRVNCSMLSGEVPQKKRVRTLEDFRAGKIRVLVATDVAGRGIHVEGISHVINYTLPLDPEDYVHRIGRTGRAGAAGTSVSFACEDDAFYIPDIEKFLGQKLHCINPDEDWLRLPPKPESSPPRKARQGSAAGRSRRPDRSGKGPKRTQGRGRSMPSRGKGKKRG